MRHKGTSDQEREFLRRFEFLKARAEEAMAAGRLDCLLCHGSSRYLALFLFPPEFARRIGRQKAGMTYYALCDECFHFADKTARVGDQIEQNYLQWAGTGNAVQ